MENEQPKPLFEVLSEKEIVSELLTKSFAARNLSELKVIVNQKPTPVLALKTRDRVFQKIWYTRKDWVCWSEGKRHLFCWPCLLFQPKASQTWAQTGYSNMQNFLPDCKVHEKAKSHMEAYKMWKTFDASERVEVLMKK